MREIIFDTETTGLSPNDDRVIEIGALEYENRQPTGRQFHYYLNPQGRAINFFAQRVHGISAADLAGKPCFADIADEWEAFIQGAKLVAHNAKFDFGFVNAELARCGKQPMSYARMIDTLPLAQSLHPGERNKLDDLCARYNIDNRGRDLHGALLDAEILADIYLEILARLEKKKAHGRILPGRPLPPL